MPSVTPPSGRPSACIRFSRLQPPKQTPDNMDGASRQEWEARKRSGVEVGPQERHAVCEIEHPC